MHAREKVKIEQKGKTPESMVYQVKDERKK